MLQFFRDNKTKLATLVLAFGGAGLGAGVFAGGCAPVSIGPDQVKAIADCNARGVDAVLDPKTSAVTCTDATKQK
jgi:hypothetical protein